MILPHSWQDSLPPYLELPADPTRGAPHSKGLFPK